MYDMYSAKPLPMRVSEKILSWRGCGGGGGGGGGGVSYRPLAIFFNVFNFVFIAQFRVTQFFH